MLKYYLIKWLSKGTLFDNCIVKEVINMKDFLKSILSSIIGEGIIAFLGFIGAIILTIIKPCILPYIVSFIIIVIALWVCFKIFTFGVTKFKWNHVQKLEKHTLKLMKNNIGSNIQIFKTIPKKNFSGKVQGYYDWKDVSVNMVKFNAPNANIILDSTDHKGTITKHAGCDTITFAEKPFSANYEVSFTNREPKNVNMQTDFTYDVKNMEPVFYFDVSRPVKKLVIELIVEDGVPVHNVKKVISAEYGDRKIIKENKLKKKVFSENLMLNAYRFTVKSPKLLHQYKIIWEWNNN